MSLFPLDIQIKSSKIIRYIVGSATLGGQIYAGSYLLAQGSAAIVDGCTTPTLYAKGMYLTGGTCQIVSGICVLANTAVVRFSPPAALALGGLGWSLEKIGDKIVTVTNTVNPCFAASKIIN